MQTLQTIPSSCFILIARRPAVIIAVLTLVLVGNGVRAHAQVKSITLSAVRSEPAARQSWTAEWNAHPTASLRDRGVFHYRKILHLSTKPEHFPVDVSADNHLVPYVNGTRIGDGMPHPKV
jgi:hypothetical protein